MGQKIHQIEIHSTFYVLPTPTIEKYFDPNSLYKHQNALEKMIFLSGLPFEL